MSTIPLNLPTSWRFHIYDLKDEASAETFVSASRSYIGNTVDLVNSILT